MVRDRDLKAQAQQLMSQGRLNEAYPLLLKYCKRNNKDPEGWCMLGAIYGQNGSYSNAEACAYKALKAEPRFQYAYSILGNVLHAQGKHQEAVSAYQKAIKKTGSNPGLLVNLGVVLTETGDFEKAESCFREVLHNAPGNYLAQYNYAVLLTRLIRFDEALSLYEKVLEKKPMLAEAHWDYAYLLLMTGHLKKGWDEYEWRWKSREFKPRNLPYMQWDGTPLDGRKLLVYAEQGIGDEVMFASCLQDLMLTGANVTVECDMRLLPVLSRSIDSAHFHGVEDREDHSWLRDIGPFDLQIAIGSLPGIFRTKQSDFPTQGAYLHAKADLMKKWSGRLSHEGGGLKVGIAWRGGKTTYARNMRSTALEEWLPLFNIEGVKFINLQYGDHDQEIRNFCESNRAQLLDWPDVNQMSDIDDMLALISSLDLVICVDNSTAHFAGSLGVPVWNLLCVRPDWRWGLLGDSSIWYPTMRLFRQTRIDYWGDVMSALSSSLEQLVAAN